jgi:rhodanese-related sulfurtransferase
MDVAKRYQDNLPRIKKAVKNGHDYFRHNYDRYNEFRRFVFESNLTGDEITLLESRGMPQLEFNILEAYISRLLGEMSKQEPDIEVNADNQEDADPLTIRIVQEHLRHVMLDINNEHTRYEIYKDILSGGFGVLKVFTDYENPMSMNQAIMIERCEPTLCVFDKITKFSHKGDGRFCAQLFPKAKEDFEDEYPDVQLNTVSFRRDFAGFSWSYLNDNSEIVLLADYYEKKKKEQTIVQVRDGKVMTMEKYNRMVEEWNDITVPPAIIGKPRKTMRENIVRYTLIENQVLKYEETDFEQLPLVFVDGNSALIKTPKNGNIRQVTRPYVYHAKGAQRLKNYAGIALANEIENQMQSKLMVAKEALPKEEEFLQAYKDQQHASTFVFNSIHEENPEMPISNPIREVQRIPAPPEIVQAFTGADSLIQGVLGSYDASLGINNNQLSGVAIVEGATQSNSAAMPYVVGYLQGWQRVAEIYVNLMPKYMTTPKTMPIMDAKGKRHFVKINQPDGLPIDFDPTILNVVLKAGASFQIQKSRTIAMIKEMMGMSPLFAQFISEKGLDFVLDNMEGKGIEQLKELIDGWVKEMQQQKQMEMQKQQQEMQNNPMMIKKEIEMAKLQQEKAKNEAQFAVDMEKIQAQKMEVDAKLHMNEQQSSVQLVKAMTERIAKHTDLQIKKMDVSHRHLKEAIEIHHKGLETHHKISQKEKGEKQYG